MITDMNIALINAQVIDENILARILWGDEKQFGRIAIHNSHNQHYWAHQNPHVFKEGSIFYYFQPYKLNI